MLLLDFRGYDDDPQEIFNIREIKSYVKGLFNRHTNLFYFISNYESSRAMILACISPAIDRLNPNYIEIISNAAIVDKISRGIINYSKSIDENKEELQKFVTGFFIELA